MDKIKGRRIVSPVFFYHDYEPGDYGKDPRDGIWYCRPPGTNSLIGNLKNHTVTEHEDGTITVSPSILISWPGIQAESKWHGYLEKGVWREC